MIDFKALAAPFPPEKVHWRIGATNAKPKATPPVPATKGIALAYIDARDVMERLDEVCGPENWQCRYPHANEKTCCEIGIYSEERGGMIWKANGAGDTDVEGEKGAFSDAFKRAAVLWGIGRYLYDLGNIWVELEARGKSHVIKASEMTRLRAALGKTAKHQEKNTDETDPFEDPPTGDELEAKYRAALVVIKDAGSPADLKAIRTTHVDPIWKALNAAQKDAINKAGATKTEEFSQGKAA